MSITTKKVIEVTGCGLQFQIRIGEDKEARVSVQNLPQAKRTATSGCPTLDEVRLLANELLDAVGR